MVAFSEKQLHPLLGLVYTGFSLSALKCDGVLMVYRADGRAENSGWQLDKCRVGSANTDSIRQAKVRSYP